MNDRRQGYREGWVESRPPTAPSGRATSEIIRVPLLMVGTVMTGLIAGMFFAFSFSVMPGMTRLDDHAFVVAMQHNIDATLESTVFMSTFIVAPLVLGAAAVVHYLLGLRTATWWLLAALMLYVISFGITMAVHQPLNEAILAAGDPSQADVASVRSDFEGPWNGAHAIRTLVVTLALACLSFAGSSRNRAHLADPPSR